LGYKSLLIIILGDFVMTNDLYRGHFLRSAYQADTIQAVQLSHEYSGSVTQNSSNQKIINNSVVITSVDDKTRAEALAYFNSCHQNAKDAQQNYESEKSKGIAATVIGFSTWIGGSIGLAASLISPPTAITAIVIGLAAAAFGSHKTSQNQQIIHDLEQDQSAIQNQIDLWQDPIHLAVEQRQLSGSLGFKYVFDKHLKNRIVHPEEVKALWMRDFSQMLLSQQSISAFSSDLLGKSKLEYAWNGSPFEDLQINNRNVSASQLEAMANRYQECSTEYKFFNANINKQIEALNNQYQAIKQEFSNQRSIWIQPALYIYNTGIQVAKALYNQAISRFIYERTFAIEEVERDCNNALRQNYTFDARRQIEAIKKDAIAKIHRDYDYHPGVLAVEDAYRRDRLMCSFLFDQSKLVVDSFFDQRTQRLDTELVQANQQIEQQRHIGESYFSHLLNKILHGSSEEIKNLHFSPPTVTKQWALSDFGCVPSWNDIYGRTPQFQPAFSTTLTKDIWNLFWGTQGLGGFASSPIHSWGQSHSDHSRFSLPRHYFNLHRIPCEPSPHMFCQHLAIPCAEPSRVVPGTRNSVQAASKTVAGTIRRVIPGTRAEQTSVAPKVTKMGFGGTKRR
jgi:hypothetical protein